MDPLSIITACVSLLGGITTLPKQIASFAIVAHEARNDMDAFARELTSPRMCLEAFRGDGMARHYPEALRPNLVAIIRECAKLPF